MDFCDLFMYFYHEIERINSHIDSIIGDNPVYAFSLFTQGHMAFISDETQTVIDVILKSIPPFVETYPDQSKQHEVKELLYNCMFGIQISKNILASGHIDAETEAEVLERMFNIYREILIRISAVKWIVDQAQR